MNNTGKSYNSKPALDVGNDSLLVPGQNPNNETNLSLRSKVNLNLTNPMNKSANSINLKLANQSGSRFAKANKNESSHASRREVNPDRDIHDELANIPDKESVSKSRFTKTKNSWASKRKVETDKNEFFDELDSIRDEGKSIRIMDASADGGSVVSRFGSKNVQALGKKQLKAPAKKLNDSSNIKFGLNNITGFNDDSNMDISQDGNDKFY